MDIDWSAEQRDARAELAALQRQRDRRDDEPLLLCKLITRWPVKAFMLTLLGHLSMIGLTGVLYLSGYDILPLFLDDVPLRLVDEPWDARLFAWNDRNKYEDYYTRGGSGSGFRTSEAWYSAIDLYYENADGENIFAKKSLMKIKQLEDELMGMKNYDTFCKLDVQTSTCVKPQSVLRYFDGTFLAIHPVFNDSNFENIKAVLYEAYVNTATRDDFKFFLAKAYNVSGEEVISPLTRSLFSFGQPHEQFSVSDYEIETETYSGKTVRPILEQYEEVEQFKLSYRSEALWMYIARNHAMSDVLWAGASMAFIFLVILLHTRSLWIAGFGILSIFASFFTGNLLYNLVFRFEYVGYFHILALFIILGIGADNIFVFYDIWRNTGCDEYLSVAHRLSDCYKRSVFSMLFTSLTTAVAFLSSAITPLLGTRSFGVFSALVVIVNYMSIILYFPTVVIMYHLYFENATWPCCYPCLRRPDQTSSYDKKGATQSTPGGDSDTDSKQSVEEAHTAKINSVYIADEAVSQSPHWSSHFNNSMLKIERPKLFPTKGLVNQVNEVYRKKTDNLSNASYSNEHSASSQMSGKLRGTNLSGRSTKINDSTSWLKSTQNKALNGNIVSGLPDRKSKKKSPFVRFFRNYYFRFVTNKYAKWVIILIFVGVLAFFIYQASKIEPDNELFNILPDDHPMMKAYRYKLYSFVESFGQAHALMSVRLLFGIKPNDLTDCHFSEPVCTGRQGWDANFNPNTEDAQRALMKLCETLRTMPEKKADELHMQRHPITGEYNIKCFMDNLQAFLLEESRLTGTNWSLPFTREQAISFAAARPQFFNASVLNGDFDNSLEIAISYWLTNRYSGTYTDDFYTFDTLIGEEIGAYSSSVKTNPDIMYGNNLKFVAVSVGTTIQAALLGYTKGEVIMERWEEFVNNQLDKMPRELKTGFQTASHERWVWITRQRLLVENAIYGITIGLCLACVILIIATGNIITGLLATLSLCCCTVCVIGVIVLGGWKLGLLEAMNMCMVVGLSVDYVVHLAEGYTLSLHYDRLSRVRDMLDLMAVSVFFGAFTTLGASLFMFFTVLSFFSQFGTFLFSTIGFSLLFSMGLFTTLLGILGPEGDTGNVIAMCKRICCRKNGRRNKRGHRH